MSAVEPHAAQAPWPPEATRGDGHTNVDALADAIADRVADRLAVLLAGQDRPAAGELVDVATLARLFGVSADTVRRHADELGAQAVGGARGRGRRLRFDVDRARTAWATGRPPSSRSQDPASPASKPSTARRRRPDSGSGPDLLPIRGRERPA